MSSQGEGGSGDAAGVIITVILAGLVLYFYKYIVFFVWIPTKITELWIWSRFNPHYTQNLQNFVDHIRVFQLHWHEAQFVNGQVLSIWSKGWIKPIAFFQTGLSVLLAALVWYKVRQHGMRPISSVTELVSVQKKQFPWGWFWLESPRNREAFKRPHEVFGREPVFENTCKILTHQCGRRHLELRELSPKLQALYGAFALQNQGKIDAAQAVLRSLALGEKTTVPECAKDWDARQERFHFERTIFADALFNARSKNLLPSSWFNWLKVEDRVLWMTLNSTPPYRQVIKPFRVSAEAMGPLAWWVYAQYRTVDPDRLDTTLETAFGSLTTLEETLKEVDYAG